MQIFMKVIDDFIPKDDQNQLENLFLNNNYFPYYYEYNTVIGKIQEESVSNISNIILQSQFVHKLYDCGEISSTAYTEVMNLFRGTGIESLSPQRIKVNLLQTPFDRSKGIYHTPHVDHGDDGYVSLLYYVNDSDGDTYFFDKTTYDNYSLERYKEYVNNLTVEKRVSPKKGRVVIFDSNRFHAGSPPFNHNSRCVLNMVFKK